MNLSINNSVEKDLHCIGKIHKKKTLEPLNPGTLGPLFPTTSHGFTLIELAVALFIAGILLTLTLPNLPDITGYRLKSASRRIANNIKYLRDRAVVEKKYLRLTFQVDKGSYDFYAVEGKEWVLYRTDYLTQGRLHESVRFVDVEVYGTGKKNTGQVSMVFSPRGMVDKTVIHLDDRGEREITILVHSATGKVTIHDGYIETATVRG